LGFKVSSYAERLRARLVLAFLELFLRMTKKAYLREKLGSLERKLPKLFEFLTLQTFLEL
jgi:hypothetical protein